MHPPSFVSALAMSSILFVAACQGGAGGEVDNSQARKDRVLENLKAKYPQLAQLNPTVADFKRVTPGMDEVEMTIPTPRGEQKQKILATADGKSAYIVMEGPIDVTRDAAQLKAEAEKSKSERMGELKRVADALPARGNANAKVTIVEFSDFQCPFCKRGADTMEQVLQKFPNDVKVIFMHFPLAFHPWAKPAAVASVCAAQQDPQAFWKLHDSLFANQDGIDPNNVIEKTKLFLAGTKVSLPEWEKCAKDVQSAEYKQASAKVDEAMQLGSKLGVEGTPAFFVNGEFLNGAVPFDEFEKVIKKQLGDKG